MIGDFLHCVVQLEEHIFEGALPLSLVPPDLFCTSHQTFPPFGNFQVAIILFSWFSASNILIFHFMINQVAHQIARASSWNRSMKGDPFPLVSCRMGNWAVWCGLMQDLLTTEKWDKKSEVFTIKVQRWTLKDPALTCCRNHDSCCLWQVAVYNKIITRAVISLPLTS